MTYFFLNAAMIAGLSAGLCLGQELPDRPAVWQFEADSQDGPPAPPAPPAGLGFAQELPPKPPKPPKAPDLSMFEGDSYRAGQSALDRREYDRAVERFNRVVASKSSRADGALYWRAYAENKIGKRSEALATLAELARLYPSSRWLEDGKALEVEVRQASGQPVKPENSSDDEIKIIALNNVIQSEPERSVPILERLLKSNNSPKVKERALFVLAQSQSPRSRTVMLEVAKGGGYNPDLQAKALEYLGIFGGKENAQALMDVYRSSNDVAIKRSVLRGFMISGNRDALMPIAKSDPHPELRVEAIRELSTMGSPDLLQLYTPDAPVEVKRAIVESLFRMGQAEKLADIAGTDKDVTVRREALRTMGQMGAGKTGAVLSNLYAKEADVENKKAILNALFLQQNAAALIEIAKREQNPELKKEAIRRLSMVHTKDAADYMMEILK